jgi:putative protein kinase ArgK-like GTPase of G3E family
VGVDEVMESIAHHRRTLEEAGALETRRRNRRRADLTALLVEEVTAQVMARVEADPELARTLDAVLAGSLDAYSAVARIVSTTIARP